MKVDIGKLILLDPPFLNERIPLLAKALSCWTYRHARGGLKMCLAQGMGEDGEDFGLKRKAREWPKPEIAARDFDARPVKCATVINVA